MQVKKIFNDIPLVKLSGEVGLEIRNPVEISLSNDVRTCHAGVEPHMVVWLEFAYTIRQQGDQYYFQVQITSQ